MKTTLFVTFLGLLLSLILFESLAFSFEDTRVMPRGIRLLEYRNISASLTEKTDASGRRQDLAEPLRAQLTATDMIKKRGGFEKTQLQGFLKTQGVEDADSLGTFTADLKGLVTVQALALGYGLSDRLTLGIALPYFSAKTSAAVGFSQNKKAEQVVRALYEQGNIAKAREAARELNAAATSLNETLIANGYDSIGDWENQGLGDIMLRAKYFLGVFEWSRAALQFGLTLPTGRVDDPNSLTDIAFGDGTFDQSVGLILDQPLFRNIILNEYATYTYQAASQRNIRLATDAEPIEAELKTVRYKLGDWYELGTSCRYVNDTSGVTTGLGYQYHKKFGDSYSMEDAGEAAEKLGRQTHQLSHVGEFMLGYSSVPAFQRGRVSIPFSANLIVQSQLASVNTPVANRVQVDAKVFF